MTHTPVTSTAVYDHPVSKVWTALSNEADLRKWYFLVENYEFEVGKTFTFFESEDSHLFLHRCTFTDIVPLRLIRHTWEHPDYTKGVSYIEWHFEDLGDKTRVTLTHSGIENFADAGPDFAPENYQFGWDHIVHDNLRLYLNGIERALYKIRIKASPEKIWETLWDKEKYKTWASVFCPGSYYTGKIEMGSRIHFLSPEGDGMFADVAYVAPNQHLVFQHLGEVAGFKEQPSTPEIEKWRGSVEEYQLIPSDSETLLRVEVDTDPTASYAEHIRETFPKALQAIKELSEA